VQGDELSGTDDLMERVVERDNLLAALKRVRRNRGSPGIDGMSVGALPEHLRENWERIRAELLDGSYRPTAVRRHEIPKSGGGVRQLGIPTMLDRFLQQAILQVLQPIFDPTFSEHSYGFRPGRRAQDAVCQAQRYVQSGRRWVVDVDLEKFFDRVNHDVLMARLAKRVEDKRLLRIISRYLEAGVMADGVVVEQHEGTPQGGPLSPLLANVLLDEVDRMPEWSGHEFVRYADDCNAYVKSKRAGERVMSRMVKLYAKLRLKVNDGVEHGGAGVGAEVPGLQLLGGFGTDGQTPRRTQVSGGLQAAHSRDYLSERWEVAAQSSGGATELPAGLEDVLPTGGHSAGLSGPYRWIARRLRMVQLKQWKRGATMYRELRRRGVPERLAQAAAAHGRRWWRIAGHGALHTAMPGKYLEGLGLPKLAPH
jgi:RNA-directed DNA polymerase